MPQQSPRQAEPEQPDQTLPEGRAATVAEATGGESLAMELTRHGITSVPITFFDWGGYRYSNAGDAIAAAKRGARK